MNVDWAVTCRYAESDGIVATLVGAGIDVLRVAAMPMQVGVMMAVRLAGPPEELHTQHSLGCRILNPDGSPIRTLEGAEADPMSLTFQADPGAQQIVPGWLVTPLFTFGAQWLAQELGTYTIEVWVDDSEHRNSPVHVIQA